MGVSVPGVFAEAGVEVVEDNSGVGINGKGFDGVGEVGDCVKDGASREGNEVEGLVQTMKVNLSASVRHDFCMAYSSSSVSGSEAVACCSSYQLVSLCSNFEKYLIGMKDHQDCE